MTADLHRPSKCRSSIARAHDDRWRPSCAVDDRVPTGRRSRRSGRRASLPATRPSRPSHPRGRSSTARGAPRAGSSRRRAARSSAGRRSRGSRPGPATPAWRRTVSTSPPAARGQGVGGHLMRELVGSSRRGGHLDDPDQRLPGERSEPCPSRARGFRVVGRRERIAELDGSWRDTVFLELRLP